MTRPFARIASAWKALWFQPAGHFGVVAVRSILALQGLWFLLSRPDLPELASWPAEMFSGVEPGFRLRFLLIFPEIVERALHSFGIVFLAAITFGAGRRPLLFVSALILYHFAAFEELIATSPHMYFGGFTLPVLGLFVLSFAEQPRGDSADASSEWRWPVTTIRLLLLLNYFFAGIAKLGYSGWDWFTGENIRNWMIARSTVGVAPAAGLVAESMVACWLVAIMTAVLELGAPLFILDWRARIAFAILAAAGHAGIYFTMGILFPSVLLLLILLPWEEAKPVSRRFGTATGVEAEALE